MKKAVGCALFLLLLAGAASAQGLDWFKGSPDEAFAKAKAENKLVLIDFSSYT
jgi:uncharacterized protein YyaL (SSP411 family)